MPIDHRHRCIFVHVPRTAGSSIEEALLGLDTTGPARDVSDETALFGLIPPDVRARRKIDGSYREWQHLPADELRRIATADYPTPAERPANSQLDCAKLERTFGLRLPAWQDGVAECVARLLG